MIGPSSRWRPVAAFVLLAVLAGCSGLDSGRHGDAPAGDEAARAATHLRIGGSATVVFDDTRRRFTPAAFAERIASYLRQGRHASATILARQYPDLVAAAISDGRADAATLDFLAEIFDANAVGSGGRVAEREWSAAHLAEAARIAEQRAQVMTRIREGRFDEAAARVPSAPADAPTSWPTIDRNELLAWIARLQGNATKAAELFDEAATLASSLDDATSWRLSLLAIACRAPRPAKDDAPRWQRIANSTLIETMRDPFWLELLRESRPPQADWPSADFERRLEARVGMLHGERAESKAAVVSLRRALSLPGDAPTDATLRLALARGFVDLGETEVATSMLVGLTATEVAPNAYVALGILEARAGRIARGQRYMQRGLDAVPIDEAPDLHADLALVGLTNDEEAPNALRLLERCAEIFRQRGETGELLRLLGNERAYFRATGSTERATEIERTIASTEATIAIR